MRHAVEGRNPLLDHRVVTVATVLPLRLKMKVLDQKYLLKQAAYGLVPESIRKRPKQPYRVLDGRSFLGTARNYVDPLLYTDTVRRQGVFDPRAVGALRAKFTSGRATGTADNMAFVAILSTGLLLDTFVDRREIASQDHTSVGPPVASDHTHAR